MKQTSFASVEYADKRRQPRQEHFLAEMNAVVQWSQLEALIEPHYPRSRLMAQGSSASAT